MIVRIVHMFFEEDKTAEFLSIFEEVAPQIRNFEGCTHLELWENKDVPGGFTTYSHWEGEEFLEKYRYSKLFEKTWGDTKKLFKQSPKAYSFEKTKFTLS
ncbi:MAG: antibiotic biosynthesis monooxygenase [Chitinophagaceae bacterium]|nr:MAG: antibiotic biosynthesis monooxygenase [Chitinophagaceae bacterium]